MGDIKLGQFQYLKDPQKLKREGEMRGYNGKTLTTFIRDGLNLLKHKRYELEMQSEKQKHESELQLARQKHELEMQKREAALESQRLAVETERLP